MSTQRRSRFLVTGVVFALVVLACPGVWPDQWASYEGQCTPTFQDYRGVPVGLLQSCLTQWYQHRDLANASESERSLVAEAAAHLFKEGDRTQEGLARLVLSRLGVTPPPKAAASRETAEPRETRASREPERELYRPAEVSESAMRRAKKARKKGFKAYRRRRYEAALRDFERAINLYPGYVQALYDAACTSALLGRRDDAIEYLRKLVDVGERDRDALRRVHKARTDEDFVRLREDQEFQTVTGYVRVKVVNGLGEYGEDEVDRIVKTAQRVHYHVVAGVDRKKRTTPVIWFKPESRAARNAAYILEKIVNHPRTEFKPIDWESEFDVIVSWGDEIEFDDHGDPVEVRTYAPPDPEATQDELLDEQDKAVREPQTYARKVDRAVETPERMGQRLEQSGRRVDDTMRTIDRTGDRIRGIIP